MSRILSFLHVSCDLEAILIFKKLTKFFVFLELSNFKIGRGWSRTLHFIVRNFLRKREKRF